jgi:hypothetical protein
MIQVHYISSEIVSFLIINLYDRKNIDILENTSNCLFGKEFGYN